MIGPLRYRAKPAEVSRAVPTTEISNSKQHVRLLLELADIGAAQSAENRTASPGLLPCSKASRRERFVPLDFIGVGC